MFCFRKYPYFPHKRFEKSLNVPTTPNSPAYLHTSLFKNILAVETLHTLKISYLPMVWVWIDCFRVGKSFQPKQKIGWNDGIMASEQTNRNKQLNEQTNGQRLYSRGGWQSVCSSLSLFIIFSCPQIKIKLPDTEYCDVNLDVTDTFLDCRTPK